MIPIRPARRSETGAENEIKRIEMSGDRPLGSTKKQAAEHDDEAHKNRDHAENGNNEVQQTGSLLGNLQTERLQDESRLEREHVEIILRLRCTGRVDRAFF